MLKLYTISNTNLIKSINHNICNSNSNFSSVASIHLSNTKLTKSSVDKIFGLLIDREIQCQFYVQSSAISEAEHKELETAFSRVTKLTNLERRYFMNIVMLLYNVSDRIKINCKSLLTKL